jgi:hypothetical protein
MTTDTTEPLEDEPCDDCDDFAELVGALARAQAAFPVVRKTKTAKAGSYTYTYASLDDVLAAVRPALNAEGIALLQDAVNRGNSIVVTTTIRRGAASIDFAPFELPVADASPQGVGSALTYARRYALSTALGIAAEEDDDGTLAQPAKAARDSAAVTETVMRRLHAVARKKGITHEQMTDWAGRHLGIESLTELTKAGAAEMEKSLNSLPDAEDGEPAVMTDA